MTAAHRCAAKAQIREWRSLSSSFRIIQAVELCIPAFAATAAI